MVEKHSADAIEPAGAPSAGLYCQYWGSLCLMQANSNGCICRMLELGHKS